MNKRHYEHTLPNIRGSLSNTYVSPRLFRDRFLFEVAISFFVAKLVCRRARPSGLDQWRIAQIFLYRACGLGLRLQNKEYLCAILGAALYCTYFLCTVRLIY